MENSEQIKPKNMVNVRDNVIEQLQLMSFNMKSILDFSETMAFTKSEIEELLQVNKVLHRISITQSEKQLNEMYRVGVW